MISDEDKSKIVAVAKAYDVSRVLLFGSSAEPGTPSHDIDLAVEGLPPARFFSFYRDLLFSLSKPVDLVDLRGTSRFVRMVASEGVPLYG